MWIFLVDPSVLNDNTKGAGYVFFSPRRLIATFWIVYAWNLLDSWQELYVLLFPSAQKMVPCLPSARLCTQVAKRTACAQLGCLEWVESRGWSSLPGAQKGATVQLRWILGSSWTKRVALKVWRGRTVDQWENERKKKAHNYMTT